MKICEKCGASNSDRRRFCIDCGEILGDKLSAAQEQQHRNNIGEQIEKMYNKKDPLYVSGFDKIVGYISLAGAGLTVVVILINLIYGRNCELLGCPLLFFGFAFLDAIFPRVLWGFKKFDLDLYIDGADDFQPSIIYLYARKISNVILAVIGIVTFVMNFL